MVSSNNWCIFENTLSNTCYPFNFQCHGSSLFLDPFFSLSFLLLFPSLFFSSRPEKNFRISRFTISRIYLFSACLCLHIPLSLLFDEHLVEKTWNESRSLQHFCLCLSVSLSIFPFSRPYTLLDLFHYSYLQILFVFTFFNLFMRHT